MFHKHFLCCFFMKWWGGIASVFLFGQKMCCVCFCPSPKLSPHGAPLLGPSFPVGPLAVGQAGAALPSTICPMWTCVSRGFFS